MPFSKRTYSQFLETLPDAALVVNGAGKIVLANTAAEALLGCPPGALPAQPLSVILPAASWAPPPDQPADAPAQTARRPDGSEFLTDLQLKPLRLGRTPMTVVTLRVSPARAAAALRETQATLNAMINSTADLIWSVEPRAFRLLTFNQALFDHFLGEMDVRIQVGTPLDEIFPALEYVQRWQAYYQRALADGPFTTEYVTYARQHTLQLAFNVLRRGDTVFGISVFAEDVTERRCTEAAEREQRRLAEALRDTAQALNSTLDPDELLGQILANVERVVPSDASGIILAEGGLGRVARVAIQPGSGVHYRPVGFAWSIEGLPDLREMWATGRPVCIADTTTDPRWQHFEGDDWNRSYVGAPIRVRGAVLGFINLHSATPGFYQPKHAEALLAFADQAASALENARLLAETRRRLDELAQSEARFSQIFARSPVPITLSRLADSVYLDANEAFWRLSGFSRDEVIGRTPVELGIYPDLARRDTLLAVFRERGRVEGFDQPFRTRSGAVVDTRLWLEPVTNREEACLLALALDVTKQKQADEALAQERNLLRTLIDQLPHAIYVKDSAGRFVIKNLADARKMGALSPDETIGKTDFDFYPHDLAARYHADDMAVITSGQAIVNREEPITEATGRTGWVMTTKVPLRDRQGKITGLVGIGYDITDSKRAAEEIQHRLAELESVNRVSTALRAAQRLDEMLPRLLAEAVAIVGGSAGAIWLYEPATDEVWLACEQGWGPAPLHFGRGEGIPGHVVATGQAYTTRDLRTDPQVPAAIREQIPAGRGGAAVPIRAADEISGVLFINTELPGELSPADVHLLTTLAEIAGNAIHRMRLHEQTERRLRQLSALRAIDIAISSSLDLRITLNVLVDQALALLKVDAMDVLLLDAPTQTLVCAVGRGFRQQPVGLPGLPVGQGYAGRIALERSVIALPEGADEAPHAARLPAGEGFRAYYGLPLNGNGHVAGVLEIYHRSPLRPDSDWQECLEALTGQAAIAIDNARLVAGLQNSNYDLSQAYEATIEGWSRALDLRDKETEGHSQRVTALTLQLAVAVGMQAEQLVHVRRGALLHDIGKMGVPDRILLKPGPLTDDEWVVMRLHPQLAHDMLAPIEYLRTALDIPYCHHEKWDGTGYPQRLAGEAIPLAARIFAVVDVWDALRSDRPYRPAWPADRVREYIQSMAGTHFDPHIVPIALEAVLRDDRPERD